MSCAQGKIQYAEDSILAETSSTDLGGFGIYSLTLGGICCTSCSFLLSIQDVLQEAWGEGEGILKQIEGQQSVTHMNLSCSDSYIWNEKHLPILCFKPFKHVFGVLVVSVTGASSWPPVEKLSVD